MQTGVFIAEFGSRRQPLDDFSAHLFDFTQRCVKFGSSGCDSKFQFRLVVFFDLGQSLEIDPFFNRVNQCRRAVRLDDKIKSALLNSFDCNIKISIRRHQYDGRLLVEKADLLQQF